MITIVLVTVVAGLVGAIAHELVHLLVAGSLGVPAWIDWRSFGTQFLLPEDRVPWGARIAALAPATLGVAGLITWILVGAPALLPGIVFFALLIGADVIVGGHSDVAMARGEPVVVTDTSQ